MAVVARCKCGNRMSLSDALAGRTIPCPKCGGDIDVPAAGGGGGGGGSAAAPAARKKTSNTSTPSITINPAIIAAVVIVGGIVVTVLVMWLGPWTVGAQWSKLQPKANTETTDVVDFALRAYESQHDHSLGLKMRAAPGIQGDAVFRPPGMVMSMPRKILFGGTTTQGHYEGHYDTSSGEVDVNIEVGGANIGGLVDTRKATNVISVTGREKDGTVSAEMNGEPMKIIVPPTRRHGDD